MTTKLEQAARQALEALEVSTDWDICAKGKQLQSMKAITALREALAEQAEQEPVAWKDMAFARLGVVRDKMQPEDVVVVQRFLDGDYAAPVRTKDLTDDEILEADNRSHGNTEWTKKKAFARAVIAADREKNK